MSGPLRGGIFFDSHSRFLSQLHRYGLWTMESLAGSPPSPVSTFKRHLKTYLFMAAYSC